MSQFFQSIYTQKLGRSQWKGFGSGPVPKVEGPRDFICRDTHCPEPSSNQNTGGVGVQTRGSRSSLAPTGVSTVWESGRCSGAQGLHPGDAAVPIVRAWTDAGHGVQKPSESGDGKGGDTTGGDWNACEVGTQTLPSHGGVQGRSNAYIVLFGTGSRAVNSGSVWVFRQSMGLPCHRSIHSWSVGRCNMV